MHPGGLLHRCRARRHLAGRPARRHSSTAIVPEGTGSNFAGGRIARISLVGPCEPTAPLRRSSTDITVRAPPKRPLADHASDGPSPVPPNRRDCLRSAPGSVAATSVHLPVSARFPLAEALPEPGSKSLTSRWFPAVSSSPCSNEGVMETESRKSKTHAFRLWITWIT